MGSIYARGQKLSVRYKNKQGKWISQATTFAVGQENEARNDNAHKASWRTNYFEEALKSRREHLCQDHNQDERQSEHSHADQGDFVRWWRSICFPFTSFGQKIIAMANSLHKQEGAIKKQ